MKTKNWTVFPKTIWFWQKNYSFAVILSVWYALQANEQYFGNHMDISIFVHIYRCDDFYLLVRNLIL